MNNELAGAGLMHVEDRLNELERISRITRDIEAIKSVTHQYCRAADMDGEAAGPGYVDGIRACFTDDGVWDGGSLGRAEGAEGFEKQWGRPNPPISFATHLAVNPVIDVDGDIATGEWNLLGQAIFRGEAVWTAGRYHNTYRRTATGWRIKLMIYEPWMWSRHSAGWADERFFQIVRRPRPDTA